MSRRRERGSDGDPFARSDSVESAADAIFGGGGDAIPETRVTARFTPLAEIYADLEQPRRLVPIEVRRYVTWRGEPEQFEAMLLAWLEFAQDEHRESIDPVKVLMAHESVDISPNTGNPLVDRYVALLELAASIRKDGLANPITVYRRQPSGYFVETGERRLIAHHLLRLYLGDDWAKIPATVKEKNIWLQAFENNQRQDLTGVGMARQFALLLMDMYSVDAHVEFDPMAKLVLPGEPDQPFYAQVENSERYKIKHGRSQEVKKALDVKSGRMLSHLRDILRMPVDLWVQADEGEWSVNKIMEQIDQLEGTNKTGQSTPQTDETYTDRYTFDGNRPNNPPGGVRTFPKTTSTQSSSTPPPSPLPEGGEGGQGTAPQSEGKQTPTPSPSPESGGGGQVTHDPVEDVPEYVLSDEVPATFMGMMAHLLSLFGREDDAEFSLWLRDLRYDELNQMDGRELAVRLARAKELLNGFMVGEMLDLMDHWFDRIGEEYGDMPHGT